MTLLRLSALFTIVSSTLSLLACSSGTAQGDGAPGAIAQPLMATCSGAYLCTTDDSNETTMVTLARNSIDMCMAGTVVFEKDQDVTTDAGGHENLGKWKGDSLAFEICASDGCIRCKAEGTGGLSSSPSSGATGSCTGSTSCSSYGAGSCSTHEGCRMHARAVYSFGKLDHYENECEGSTPSCSSHSSKSECEREDCTWE